MDKPLICPKCGQYMCLDDSDFNFKGNYDNYWICYPCHITAFEKVRFGKSYSVEYGEEEIEEE